MSSLGLFRAAVGALVLAVCATGCDLAVRIHPPPPDVAKPGLPPKTAAVAKADPLGPRPTLDKPKTFVPRPPQEFEASGIKVWLVERPGLPLVSAAFVVPSGSSNDPSDKPGLAQLTADMMDEGAGKLGAVELSTAVADLGASLSVSANLDASFASVSSLKGKFADAFSILSDVVARPRLEQKEFSRVSGLWKNALKKRGDEPSQVAMLVAQGVRFGIDSPYGHPGLGLLSKADAVHLDDVKKFWMGTWRPERATLVVTGQITRAEIEALLKKNLGEWKPQGDALPPLSTPETVGPAPRLVLVDRPKAVQSVVIVVRDGVRAGSEESAPLDLVNTALGGGFTSRLNQNLREDKGWTYGAGSSFQQTRRAGLFYARSSVEAQFTGRSVQEFMKELSLMSDKGLTAEELEKTKAQDRADLVSTYETTSGTNSELASLASLGLPGGYDLTAAERRQTATLDGLAKLAKAHVDPTKATIVIVGDTTTVKPQLAQVGGLPEPELYTVEGSPVGKAPVAVAKPPAEGPKVEKKSEKGGGEKKSEKGSKGKAHKKDPKKK